MKNDILIIGAGLTGLALAYFLKKKNVNALILEANNKIGGRIHTVKGANNTTLEMGATWFSDQHLHLKKLLSELGLAYFKQHTEGISLFETAAFTPPQKFEIPSSEEPSYRIIGGTSVLTNTLAKKLDKAQIKIQTKVVSIEEHNEELHVFDNNGGCYVCKKVITTMPPNLLINNIDFQPGFSNNEINIFKNTHTWMGESIKFAVEYKRAFWKDKGYSGVLFSHANIIQEQYDHSGYNNETFALKGFLNGSSADFDKETREKKAIKQLSALFGKEAQDYVTYNEKVWQFDELTFSPYTNYVLPHQNNGNSLYQKAFFNGKLFIAGTETSPVFGGYMDGAVNSALNIAVKL